MDWPGSRWHVKNLVGKKRVWQGPCWSVQLEDPHSTFGNLDDNVHKLSLLLLAYVQHMGIRMTATSNK